MEPLNVSRCIMCFALLLIALKQVFALLRDLWDAPIITSGFALSDYHYIITTATIITIATADSYCMYHCYH